MRKIFFVGLALSSVGAYLYYRRQVNLLYNVSYSIGGFKILERNANIFKVEITMLVKNCSELPLTITGYNLDVLVNNEQVTKIVDSGKSQTLQPNGGVSPITFVASFNPKEYGLLDIIASLIDTGKGTNITIQGNVSLYSGLLISNKHSVELNFKLEDFIGKSNTTTQATC